MNLTKQNIKELAEIAVWRVLLPLLVALPVCFFIGWAFGGL